MWGESYKVSLVTWQLWDTHMVVCSSYVCHCCCFLPMIMSLPISCVCLFTVLTFIAGGPWTNSSYVFWNLLELSSQRYLMMCFDFNASCFHVLLSTCYPVYLLLMFLVPSVFWYCWLGIRKSIPPVKNWVVICWHGCLYGARCKWSAYGPVDVTATPSSLASLKSRLVEPFLCQLTQVVLKKRPLNGCLSIAVPYRYAVI